MKLSFLNETGIQVNKENYFEHLKKIVVPTIKKLAKRDDFIFVQDSVRSHRSNLVQDFFEKTLKCRFAKYVEWPHSSHDVNSLDYFFLGSWKNEDMSRQSWRAIQFRRRIKNENKSCVERLCNRFEIITKSN